MSDIPTFALARVSIRSPRVAVVIPGDVNWEYWARIALFASSQCWGGQGFVLVPHDHGVVDPTLLQVVVAYDPDYVVRLGITVGQLEAVEPGSVSFATAGGETSPEIRDRLLTQVRDDILDDDLGEQARQQVAAACTPYRQRVTASGEPDEYSTLLTVAEENLGLPKLQDLEGVSGGIVLACPPDWAGTLAVLAASRVGCREEPRPGTAPGLDEPTSRAFTRWLLAAPGGAPPFEMVWFPAAAVSVDPADLASAFDRTHHGLTKVQRGRRPSRETVVFVGDEPADFALALVWDRLYGDGLWLPSSLWASALATRAPRTLFATIGGRTGRRNGLRYTSASIPREELSRLIADWHGTCSPDARRRDVPDVGTPPGWGAPEFTREGAGHLAVPEQFDRQVSVPVEVDRWGSRTLLVPPPLAMPDAATFDGPLPSSWEVDFEFREARMPRMRGLDGSALLAPDEPLHEAWVRSARDGISYHSYRYGFVAAGSSLESKLARPRVRDLGLHDWVEAQASMFGYQARLSAAGNRLSVLADLWGSREALVTDMAGPLQPVLKAFVPREKRTSAAYPSEGHGVVLDAREGYLSFPGMEARMEEGPGTDFLRRKVDWFTERGVLRRGLVLDCAECQRPSFVSVDRLGQSNECQRCGSTYQLTSARWRRPMREPIWFYDLHWAMRQQLEQNGDVPLLLSHYLRGQASRSYSDLPEFEFAHVESGGTTEIDLIFHRSDRLGLAEAKSINSLGSGKTAERTATNRVRLAKALRADELVLATTEPEWKESSLTRMRDAVDREAWPAGARPSLRVITSLGGDAEELLT